MANEKSLVHLYLPDGTVLCKGMDVVELARPIGEAIRVTIIPDDVTCPVCVLGAIRLGVIEAA